jgi:hypothetical protein
LRPTASIGRGNRPLQHTDYHYVAKRVKWGAISVNEKSKSIGVAAIRIIGDSRSPG